MRRAMLAAAVVMVMALPASAQEFTVAEVVIPTTQRQGTFQSGSVSLDVVPDRREGDRVYKLAVLRLNIPTADFEDPLNTIWFRFFVSNDSGASWISAGAARWQGGRYVNDDGVVNPAPEMTPSLPAGQGWILRAEIDVPRRMRAGATVVY